jgi:plastocyanin
VLLLFAAACSKSASPEAPADGAAPPPPEDASLGDATDGPEITDASVPAVDAPDVLFNYNDCTNIDFDQNDESAPDASRNIVFSFHANVQQYAPRCIRIAAGESVTWEGDFTDHPLVGAGGDVPNPVDLAAISSGTTGTITFAKAGWYGFECKVHESPSEYGAILVTP